MKQMYHKFIFSDKTYRVCDYDLLITYLLFDDIAVSFHIKEGNVGLPWGTQLHGKDK